MRRYPRPGFAMLVAGMLMAAMGLFLPLSALAQTHEPAAGIALDLATARARDISQLRYELSLSIPPTRQEPVTGTNLLRFRLANATRPLVIDFDTDGAEEAVITANGVAVPTRAVNGHLVIPPSHLRRGENTVRIDFRAGDAPLNRGDDLLYTWFVPANARRAIPCFDQPDLKGRWSLTLEHPAQWQSVTNGAERERRRVVDKMGDKMGERVQVRFQPTQPLPTYVVAFVVGQMKVETATRGGRTMRMFHREDDAAKLARNREALFDLHAQSLAALERYTGIPYPFGKFDFVLIPAFQPGAMEHAGVIGYKAEDYLLEASATQEQLLRRATVIAHETAHMWFGNLVTMRWFDDVWTKEVFANFIADKVIQPLFPQVRHDLQFFIAHYWAAYNVERSANPNPIRQPLDNLNAAGSVYGAIVYEKSPVVMRQLEALLGEAAFRDGVRSYLSRHAFGNATWDDLIAALAGYTRLDLKRWSRMWVDEPGRPVIRTVLDVQGGQVQRLALQQQDPQGRGRLWPQQLRLTLGCPGQPRRLVADLVGAEIDLTRSLTDPSLQGCVPDYVLAGGEAWGYGEFVLDARSQAHLLTQLPNLADPLARAVAWSALWDAMLAQRLAPTAWFEMALQTLRTERDAQLFGDWAYDLCTVWWQFLTPAQRTERAATLEALLRERLDAASDAGAKATWFGWLRKVALTPGTVSWLRALWQREATIPGLPLTEADETALAYELGLRGVADLPALLDAQAGRITNPDRKARFAFVRGAVAPDAAERERWFRALADPAQRRHEEWIVQGLGMLNHPLRGEQAAPWLPAALDLLLDVHRTGALFFDANWLAASLRWQSSPQAAAKVKHFLDTLPADYPPKLRDKVVQGADLLMRAAQVTGR